MLGCEKLPVDSFLMLQLSSLAARLRSWATPQLAAPLLPHLRFWRTYVSAAGIIALTALGYWQYPNIARHVKSLVVRPVAGPAAEPAPATPLQLATMADLQAVQTELREVEQAVDAQRAQVQQAQEKAAELQGDLKDAVAAVLATNDRLQAQAAATASPAGGGSQKMDGTTALAGKVNLNTASLGQLETLPGIGATYAQRIIEYRAKNGPFKKIEDLEKVQGIGDATFAKLKDDITV